MAASQDRWRVQALDLGARELLDAALLAVRMISYDDLATALVKRNEADRRVARQTRSRKLPG